LQPVEVSIVLARPIGGLAASVVVVDLRPTCLLEDLLAEEFPALRTRHPFAGAFPIGPRLSRHCRQCTKIVTRRNYPPARRRFRQRGQKAPME